jgi:hypothetical protein
MRGVSAHRLHGHVGSLHEACYYPSLIFFTQVHSHLFRLGEERPDPPRCTARAWPPTPIAGANMGGGVKLYTPFILNYKLFTKFWKIKLS